MHNLREYEVVYRGEVCIVKTRLGTDVFVDGDLDRFIFGVYHSKQLFDKKIKPLLEEEQRRHSQDIDGYRRDYAEVREKYLRTICFTVFFGLIAAIQALYHLILR